MNKTSNWIKVTALLVLLVFLSATNGPLAELGFYSLIFLGVAVAFEVSKGTKLSWN